MEFYLFTVSLTIWLIVFPSLYAQGMIIGTVGAPRPPSEAGVCSPRHNVPRDLIGSLLQVEVVELIVTNTLLECAMGCVYMTWCSYIAYEKDSKICQRYEVDLAVGEYGQMEQINIAYLGMTNFIQLLANTGNPCLSKPCPFTSKCVPVKNSYVCEHEYDEYANCAVPYLGGIIPDIISDLDIAVVSSNDIGSRAIDLLFFTGWCNGWTPASNDASPFIQIEFLGDFIIKGILTRGNPSDNKWVTSYTVHRSDDPLCNFATPILDPVTGLEKVFEGNTEPFNSKLNFFDEPFFALCIRIIPDSSSEIQISTRLDVIGCYTRKTTNLYYKETL